METFAQVGSGTGEKVDVPLMQYSKPLRTWAGHGSGAKCNGCGGTIQPHEIEYEIELPAGGAERTQPFQAAGNGRSLHFHFACYRNWSRR